MARTVSDISLQPLINEDLLQRETPIYKPWEQEQRSIEDKVTQLKEKVFAARPVLSSIMQLHGNKSLVEFSKISSRTNYSFKNESRKQEFIAVFTGEIGRLLGPEVAESARQQIGRYYTVSTAEHNAPLTHTNYLNGSLIASLPLFDPIDPAIQNIFVLSCANISFDNYVMPRGLLLTSTNTGRQEEKQLVFFPRNARPCPVVHYKAYTKEAIETAKLRIQEWIREGSLSSEDGVKLTELVEEIYASDDVLNATYYTEQITKTNFALWKKLFKKDEMKAPNMIFLEQENIVNKLLLSYHMSTDTPIGKLLFDKTYHELFLKHFDGVDNAFTLEKKAGTILFWALPPGKKYREQLWYENGYLVSNEGDYRLELTPTALKQAIENHELIPSTTLSFILLSFYYGVRLRGAFEQTTYLTHMKLAYIQMMRELKDIQSVNDCMNTPTSTLSFIRPILAFGMLPNQSKYALGTLDLLFHGCDQYLLHIREMAKKITLEEAFTRVLPLIYTFIYPENERDSLLASVSEEEIDSYLHLQEKIVPLTLL